MRIGRLLKVVAASSKNVLVVPSTKENTLPSKTLGDVVKEKDNYYSSFIRANIFFK